MIKVIETSAFSLSITISLMKSAMKSPNCVLPFQIGKEVLFFFPKYCESNYICL